MTTSPMTTSSLWAQSPHVLSCVDGDCTVLMDLKSEQYYILNGTAGQIWRVLARRQSLLSVVEALADRCSGVTATQMQSDVSQVVAMLVERQLLDIPRRRRNKPDRPSRKGRVGRMRFGSTPLSAPSRLSSFMALVGAKVVLRVIGLRRAVSLVRRFTAGATALDITYATGACARIHAVSRYSPFRAECLPRSLAAVWLLRTRGIDARLRLGTLPRPFEAHAWVEVDETPVSDDPETLSMYQPFPGLPGA